MSTPADQVLTDSREPVTLRLAPGFFSEASARGAPDRWKSGDKVRFQNGIPEKLGGWIAQILIGDDHSGVPRRSHEWSDLGGESWIAYGTHTKLFVVSRGVRYDITPIRRNITLTDPFTTTIGLATVLVTDISHGARAGDAVRFSDATAVGGITIVGEYVITAVFDGDRYQITHTSNATSSATGGGSVVAEYDINTGLATSTRARGFGACGYGESTYGTARDPNCSSIFMPIALWSLDNFGEDLIASPRDGAVYWWDRSLGAATRAVLLENAPRTNKRVLVSNSGGQIICVGAFDEVANSSDAMLIRAGAEESLTQFTVAEDNTVYEERMSTGSTAVTAIRTRTDIVVFTDTAIYALRADPVEIFRLGKIAEGNSIVGPNAGVEVDGTVHLMSDDKFMAYDGVYHELPCDVWEEVFGNFNRRQKDKVYCWFNQTFSEIWWHYPSAGSDENDRYVVYNKAQRIWYTGAIERTVGAAPGPSYDLPIAFDAAGVLYAHETGTDDNGSAMTAFIESHDIELGDGKQEMLVSKAVPDMLRQTGTIQLLLRGKSRPNQPSYAQKGPYTITTSTRTKGVKITARQIAVRYTSSALGDDWRLGSWTFYMQPDHEGNR